jgi:hypothetical protein
MRIRLAAGRFVIFDVNLFEIEDVEQRPPSDVHDVSTGHEIGFCRPAGWREPE